MKDQWYGDNRDLVKWGVLLTLVERFRLAHLLQVLYLRPSTWGKLEIAGEQVELPNAVRRHFRHAAAVATIECGIPVQVIDEVFEDRVDYLNNILQRIPDAALAKVARAGILSSQDIAAVARELPVFEIAV